MRGVVPGFEWPSACLTSQRSLTLCDRWLLSPPVVKKSSCNVGLQPCLPTMHRADAPRVGTEHHSRGTFDVAPEASSVLTSKTEPSIYCMAFFVRMLDRTCVCQCGPAVVAQHPQSHSVCALKPCVCRAQCGKKVVLVVRLLSLSLLPTHRRSQLCLKFLAWQAHWNFFMAVISNFETSVLRVL